MTTIIIVLTDKNNKNKILTITSKIMFFLCVCVYSNVLTFACLQALRRNHDLIRCWQNSAAGTCSQLKKMVLFHYVRQISVFILGIILKTSVYIVLLFCFLCFFCNAVAPTLKLRVMLLQTQLNTTAVAA